MGRRSDGLSDAAAVALGSPSRLAVLLLCERGPQTIRGLAAELELSRQVTHHHVRLLLESGLLVEVAREAHRGGPVISYRTTRPGWSTTVSAINALAAKKQP